MVPARDLELSRFLQAEDSQQELPEARPRWPRRRAALRAAGLLALGAAVALFACWPAPLAAAATEAHGPSTIGEWAAIPEPKHGNPGAMAQKVDGSAVLNAASVTPEAHGASTIGERAVPQPEHGGSPKPGGPALNIKAKAQEVKGSAVPKAANAAPALAVMAAHGSSATGERAVPQSKDGGSPKPGGLALKLEAMALKVRGSALLNAAKAKYSQAAAKAFAALAKLAYCGPLPGVFASAAYSCSALKLWGAASVCEQASFSITPGTVRMLRASDLGEYDSLFGYMARVEPNGNGSTVEPGVVIVIRGSIDNLVNSKRDKMTTMEKEVEGCQGCGVHDGYHKSYHKLEDQIRTIMTELWCQPKDCKVYVTGHGAGAAMAAMAAWELTLGNYSIGTSYIFESPQVGNEAWVDAMTAKFSGEQGPIFSITNGKDSATKWPFSKTFKSWGIEAHYKGMDATGPMQICYAGEQNCGVAAIPDSELSSEDMCQHPLAPDKDFCTFRAFVPQCYAGLGFQMTAALPKDAGIWKQPEASAAATWHPSESDGEQEAAVAKDDEPKDYYSLDVLKCASALAKLAYCGPTVGLPSAVQSSIAGSSSLGKQCGFGVVPHSVHLAASEYQSDPNATFVDTPLFGYTALVRRTSDAFAQAPFFVASEMCVVAFRGTYNKQNEALNSMVKQVDLNDTACPNCTVFQGLHSAWTAEGGLGAQVLDSLKQSGCQPHPGKTAVKRVFCVGHSLGGAMCTLAVYMLNKLGFQVELSWSLEGWRSGNQHFMDYINNKMLVKVRPVPIWHVTHEKDAIARFPASFASGGVAGRARWQAYFAGSSLKEALCTSAVDYGKDSSCGIYQHARKQLVWPRATVADHCNLPFAPNKQQCMNSGPLRQCFMGGDIMAPF